MSDRLTKTSAKPRWNFGFVWWIVVVNALSLLGATMAAGGSASGATLLSPPPVPPVAAAEEEENPGTEETEAPDAALPAHAPSGGLASASAVPTVALPPGFPPEDRFKTSSEACLTITKELVPRKWQRAIYGYCEHRSWASSRNGVVHSRVDGSQIHDRDRPIAWAFYAGGILRGTIDPDTCEHHRIDRSIRHPRKGRRLAKNWPFKRPKMTTQRRGKWLRHPHEMERFGSRGPHDNHMSTAVHYIPGCWAPEAMDRNDVGVTVTIKRSLAICERTKKCWHKSHIREHWRHGPPRKKKKRRRRRRR